MNEPQTRKENGVEALARIRENVRVLKDAMAKMKQAESDPFKDMQFLLAALDAMMAQNKALIHEVSQLSGVLLERVNKCDDELDLLENEVDTLRKGRTT